MLGIFSLFLSNWIRSVKNLQMIEWTILTVSSVVWKSAT